MLLTLIIFFTGNLQCSGENSLEQNRFCHFDSDGNGCGPTAEMILENINISASPERGTGVDGLCHCLFRGGKFVCGDSKSVHVKLVDTN